MKRLILLYFVFVCIAHVYCKGGGRGGGGRGGRGGGGIFGSIWGKSSSRNTYPASTGYSGYGSGGSHGYPSSNGLSGLIKQPGFKYGQRYGSYRFPVPRVPSYYTVPQYVYVNQYRQSNSRFNNLLIGLTMYNMGRSHVSYHHYYHDSYYRRNSSSASSNADHAVTSTSAEEKANEDKDEATCLMRITEDEKEEVLKIPCAIVTTFADGNRKLPYASNTTTTVCVNSSEVNLTSLQSLENDSNVNTSESINTDSPKNSMVCKSTIKSIDPLSVTGSPLGENVMNCTVEIWTRQEVISNEVDCEVLLKYAKMPVPQNKDAIIMPPRSELKDMLEHPPWWLSLFLVV
ncbi:uncharacterized protein LOC134742032 [Cydia strobilella]|uniref:uncharacterized protein LOC134742032 n=1 Tax=Cydia strobilella TaxID=1100964 RepID=UPI003007B776